MPSFYLSSFLSELLKMPRKSWISWFGEKSGNEWFCRVGTNYLKEGFNLWELEDKVPHYKEALRMIKGWEPNDESD